MKKWVFIVTAIIFVAIVIYMFFSPSDEVVLKTSNHLKTEVIVSNANDTDNERKEDDSNSQRDAYGDDIRNVIISFLEKEGANLTDSIRKGCLPPAPFTPAQHSNYLYSVAAGNINYSDEFAEKLCIHFNYFLSEASLSSDKFDELKKILLNFEKTIGKVSAQVLNKTEATVIFGEKRIGPNSNGNVKIDLFGPCRLGGHKPYVFDMTEKDVTRSVEVKFCNDSVQKVFDDKYELSVEGCPDFAKNTILAKTPLAVKIIIKK